jgi:hypothetical protein
VKLHLRALILGALGLLVSISAGQAADLGSREAVIGQPGAALALACQNGHTYPIHPRAVAIDGDLVTAYLIMVHGRGIHVRLVPMGFGYRYAGPGVWFDGMRGEALLYLSKYGPMPCHVVAA